MSAITSIKPGEIYKFTMVGDDYYILIITDNTYKFSMTFSGLNFTEIKTYPAGMAHYLNCCNGVQLYEINRTLDCNNTKYMSRFQLLLNR